MPADQRQTGRFAAFAQVEHRDNCLSFQEERHQIQSRPAVAVVVLADLQDVAGALVRKHLQGLLEGPFSQQNWYGQPIPTHVESWCCT